MFLDSSAIHIILYRAQGESERELSTVSSSSPIASSIDRQRFADL
ncbi:MAG: hypothetical protein RBT82_12460 [Desulfomonilia bacterium]|nr:hypothetical protein [Desulfomonilia bacterium]